MPAPIDLPATHVLSECLHRRQGALTEAGLPSQCQNRYPELCLRIFCVVIDVSPKCPVIFESGTHATRSGITTNVFVDIFFGDGRWVIGCAIKPRQINA